MITNNINYSKDYAFRGFIKKIEASGKERPLQNVSCDSTTAVIPNLHSCVNLVPKYTFDYNSLKKENIGNLHKLHDNGIRGETLSGKKNRKLLSKIKKAGIKNVIDLRAGDASSKYETLCRENGLNYYNFPLDFDKISDREIIDYLPEMFDVINNGNFYIACAQGLHRTDVAVALNYFFNPKASQIPPVMYGHNSPKGFNCEKIFKRANGIFRTLNEEDKIKLGLDKNFDENTYKFKKDCLRKKNSLICAQMDK